MNTKLICNLRGGLGNQMFQYAFAKTISDKYCLDLKFDIFSKSYNSAFCEIELEKFFNLNLNQASKKDISEFLPSIFKFDFLRVNLFRKRFKLLNYIYPKEIILENSLNFKDSYINAASNGGYLSGYWQSFRYSNPLIYHKLFDWKINLSEQSNKIYNHILNCENSVSIHFRRSDYFKNRKYILFKKHHLYPLDNKYYLKGINYFREKLVNVKFFLFSDDPKYAAKFADQYNINSYIVNNSDELSAGHDMYLMSNCKNNIISNSTFSWWAASLNKNREKQVIAPSKWFTFEDKEFISNLIPPKWKKIKSLFLKNTNFCSD